MRRYYIICMNIKVQNCGDIAKTKELSVLSISRVFRVCVWSRYLKLNPVLWQNTCDRNQRYASHMLTTLMPGMLISIIFYLVNVAMAMAVWHNHWNFYCMAIPVVDSSVWYVAHTCKQNQASDSYVTCILWDCNTIMSLSNWSLYFVSRDIFIYFTVNMVLICNWRR